MVSKVKDRLPPLPVIYAQQQPSGNVAVTDLTGRKLYCVIPATLRPTRRNRYLTISGNKYRLGWLPDYHAPK